MRSILGVLCQCLDLSVRQDAMRAVIVNAVAVLAVCKRAIDWQRLHADDPHAIGQQRALGPGREIAGEVAVFECCHWKPLALSGACGACHIGAPCGIQVL